VRSRASRLGIAPDFFENTDVHIHVPHGAIPKDGPSAGVTIVTSLASLLTGRHVRANVAMTGEITLRGKVEPVGGVKEKVLAAKRAGIEMVILPRRNEKDLEDVPDNAERFAFFCRAALEGLRTEREPPDVLHVHEWQAALAPAFLRATAVLYPELGRLRTVLTLHNVAFQGRFPADHWHVLNLDARYFVPEFLEFYGEINFLKGGMVFADALTTVSPRYAAEIQTPAFGEGLDG